MLNPAGVQRFGFWWWYCGVLTGICPQIRSLSPTLGPAMVPVLEEHDDPGGVEPVLLLSSRRSCRSPSSAIPAPPPRALDIPEAVRSESDGADRRTDARGKYVGRTRHRIPPGADPQPSSANFREAQVRRRRDQPVVPWPCSPRPRPREPRVALHNRCRRQRIEPPHPRVCRSPGPLSLSKWCGW